MSSVLAVLCVQDAYIGGSRRSQRADVVSRAIRNHLSDLDTVGEMYDAVVVVYDETVETTSETLHRATRALPPLSIDYTFAPVVTRTHPHNIDAYRDSDTLDTLLKSLSPSSVTVVGLATEYTVVPTAESAASAGYHTIVPLSLCSPVHSGTEGKTHDRLRSRGVHAYQNDFWYSPTKESVV